jgi:hypothetical protein
MYDSDIQMSDKAIAQLHSLNSIYLMNNYVSCKIEIADLVFKYFPTSIYDFDNIYSNYHNITICAAK